MNRMLLTRSLTVGVGSRAARMQSTSQGPEQATPAWPRYKPKKDRHAVLDALSKTVKPISPPKIFGRGPGDPFLYRFSGKTLFQYAQHWLTGRQAAEHVIDHNPQFFPGFRSNPKLVPDPDPLPGKEPTLENLRRLVERRHGEQAHQMYTQLRSDHPDVSVPVRLKNDLLELIMFYGVGQAWVSIARREKMDGGESKKVETADRVGSDRIDTAYFNPSRKLWTKDCPGKLLFQEMKQQGVADADTYTAYLHGLAMFLENRLFYQHYLEMLESNFHPPVSIHNVFLQLVISRHKTLNIPPEEVQDAILRVIEKMNSPPIVAPNQVTFSKIMSALVFKTIPSDKLPSLYSVFHEMFSRGISPTTQQFYYLLQHGWVNLDYVTNYIKSHPEIIRFSPDHDLNFLLSYCMRAAIRRHKPQLVEFYMQLNRETSGLLDMNKVSCYEVYLKYKIEQWDIGNRGQADELCSLLRDCINFIQTLGSTQLSLVRRFADIGRYDLTMIIMRELFLLCEGYPIAEKYQVFELFNWFVSDKLLKNESPTSDIVKEAAELVWGVIGRYERSFVQKSSEFEEFCRLAMELHKELDEKKYKRICKWLEQNSGRGITPIGIKGIKENESNNAVYI